MAHGKRRAKKIREAMSTAPAAGQPLYVVHVAIGSSVTRVGSVDVTFPARDGYVCDERPWQEVPKVEATRYTHKQAVRRANYLSQPKLYGGASISIEPA